MIIKLEIISKYFIYISVIILLADCQSTVRFSSKVTESRIESSSSKRKAAKSSEKIKKINPNLVDRTKLTSQQNAILDEANKWIGIPYCWGGENNNCVDCSGFVKQVFAKVNIYLPRTAADQYIYSEKVFYDNREIADLVFFKTNNKISHVGIYVGNDEFVHSSSSVGVTVQSLNDDYYKNIFAGYGRILKK